MSKQTYDTTIPDFKDMPEPVAVLTKSWEDYYPSAQRYTQEHWKRNPTKEEITALFDDDFNWDCEYSQYWSEIDNAVDQFFSDYCNVCGKEDCECEE